MLSGPWKVLLLGGPWKISLFGGQWKEKEKHLFTFSHFPPNKFYLNLQFFSFDFKVLLYHGSKPLLTHFLPFPWPINYDCASRCNKSSTHSSPIWFWLNIFFIFLEIMALCIGILTGLKLHKWMKNCFQSHF